MPIIVAKFAKVATSTPFPGVHIGEKNRRLERAGAETDMSAVRTTGGISVGNGKRTFTPTCWSALLNACGPRRKELQAVAAALQGTFVSQKRQRR